MTKGDRIRAARESKGITQEELGRMCGTTKQTIFKYESGTVTNIPLDRLETLAEVLDTTPAFIMGWEEQKKEPPAPGGELDEETLEFIKLYDRASPALRAAALAVLKSAESDRGAPGGEGGAE